MTDCRIVSLRPLLAGQRPSIPAVATGRPRLHFSLLRDFQRVVDLDPEVPNGAFKLRVAE